MGYSPQESLENTINTMGTLLGVHLIVPWRSLKIQLINSTIIYIYIYIGSTILWYMIEESAAFSFAKLDRGAHPLVLVLGLSHSHTSF